MSTGGGDTHGDGDGDGRPGDRKRSRWSDGGGKGKEDCRDRDEEPVVPDRVASYLPGAATPDPPSGATPWPASPDWSPPPTAAAANAAQPPAGPSAAGGRDTGGPPPPAHNPVLPSSQELAEELCRVVLAGTTFPQRDALHALGRIVAWTRASGAPPHRRGGPNRFLRDLLELGGVRHVLMFLERHIRDADCVAMAALVVANCTYAGNATNDPAVHARIVDVVVRHDGVRTLLQASRECSGTDTSMWNAIKNILMANNNNSGGSGSCRRRGRRPAEAEALLSEEHIAMIVEAALESLASLPTVHEGNTIIIATLFLIVNDRSVAATRRPQQQQPRLQNKNIVGVCLQVLTKRGDADRSGQEWNVPDRWARWGLKLFLSCCSNSSAVRVSDDDYERLIQFGVSCLNAYGGNREMQTDALSLIDAACSRVGKAFLETSGLLEAVAGILASVTSDEATKASARTIMKQMYG